MIPTGTQVFVCLEPVDMRLGFERLSGLVGERTGYDARGGALFVFLGRRRQTIKVLFFDGTGVCLFSKRLDRRTFALPTATAPDAHHVEVDDATFEALLDGIDIAPTPPKKPPARRRIH
jgi:transposase